MNELTTHIISYLICEWMIEDISIQKLKMPVESVFVRETQCIQYTFYNKWIITISTMGIY